MSRIADRIGRRYDDIIAHFRRHPFGSIPPNMTVLSILPPVDRCLILERLFAGGYGDPTALVDKLSMAYLKAGWKVLAQKFLVASFQGGCIDENLLGYFLAKIERLSASRLSAASYRDSLETLPTYEAFGDPFCERIRDLCESYRNEDVLKGVDFQNPVSARDFEVFLSERISFIQRVGGA